MPFMKSTEDKLRQIKNNFNAESQVILEEYLTPFNGSEKPDLYQLPVERISHGAQHAARVSVYIPVLVEFCRTALNGYPADICAITEEQMTLLQLAALFHDVARKNDRDKDIWEKDSAERFKEYLKTKGIDDVEALNYFKYITRQKMGA